MVNGMMKELIERFGDEFEAIVFLRDRAWTALGKNGVVLLDDSCGEFEEANESVTNRPAMFSIHDPLYTKKNLWAVDELQFARLISEAEAAGLFQNLDELQLSMDLDSEDIAELIERAQERWDNWISTAK